MHIRLQTEEDRDRLVQIWLDSVRATHDFLTEADIQFYLPVVRDSLADQEVWVAEESPGAPVGFMGLCEAKVEMLFVAPSHHGRGIGKRLLAHAGALKGKLTVDVSEQNPGAHAFYVKCGFRDVGRSESDGFGNPFPLVHMAQL